ncbi:FkbM family methyltransferase [Pseudoalteromonas byunsanensis]|uniref:FkbM family methyltransferase n=1 Tax=Pseudoalteromonas byunsanensis TaxID=327939 RepID=UPI000B229B08|nr:FkbM family methyltransferase [Pseudoalteromonas byunsanensis]
MAKCTPYSPDIVNKTRLETCLELYSTDLLDDSEVFLELKNNAFYIYGGSHFGKALVEYFSEINILPAAVLDRAPKFEHYLGVPVLPFEQGNFDHKLPVLVSILGFDGVEQAIEKAGFEQIIPTLEVFKLFPQALKILNQCGVLWMQPPLDKQVDERSCDALQSLWSDSSSLNLFNKIINYRKSPSQSSYPLPEGYEMYFPTDIPSLYAYERLRVLDVGIFDGDTFAGFYERYGTCIEKYSGVEVSTKNIAKLQTRLKNMGLSESFIEVERLAVGLPEGSALKVIENDSASTVELIDSNAIASCDSAVVVQAGDLGRLLVKTQCNILKMDIEGADYDALIQAKTYISNHTPTLALSLYHRPQDLWAIPLLIESFAPNKYNYYLRQEGHWLLETQLYAVPKAMVV